MTTDQPVVLTVETLVQKPVEEVWRYWTEPQHITQWSFASEDWHAPSAENDLRPGGKFVTRMEAKDGSFGFDFSGAYDEVRPHAYIAFTLDDERKVTVTFTPLEEGTKIVETFEAEGSNPVEMQQAGWQAFMDNFKAYSERSS